MEDLKKKLNIISLGWAFPDHEFITGLSKRYFYLLTVSSTNTKHPEDEDCVSWCKWYKKI